MKSLLLTAMLSMGVGHTGAFLSVWELPYVENHLTMRDLERKFENVTKWGKKTDSLRDRREKAADENYAFYDNQPDGRNSKLTVAPGKLGGHYVRERMKTRSQTRK